MEGVEMGSVAPALPEFRVDVGGLGGVSDAIEDRRGLFVRWQQQGDRLAREALVRHFMPLARSLARRYGRSSEPFEDLLQVASLGLLKALDRFDPERGHPFSLCRRSSARCADTSATPAGPFTCLAERRSGHLGFATPSSTSRTSEVAPRP
jgi:hypothetical protein